MNGVGESEVGKEAVGKGGSRDSSGDLTREDPKMMKWKLQPYNPGWNGTPIDTKW